MSVLVPEAGLLSALTKFFNTRLLGPDRLNLLAADLVATSQESVEDHAEQLAAVRRPLDDVTGRQTRLLRQAETADPDDPFTHGLRHRYNDLETERRTLDAFRIRITYDHETRRAHYVRRDRSGQPGRPIKNDHASCADLVGAPGRIRTCATASGGRCSIP